jgi:hypothetical protein
MAKETSLLARIAKMAGNGNGQADPAGSDLSPVRYPRGMAKAAREAKKRLVIGGKLEVELDAQREINGRVDQFGKAA